MTPFDSAVSESAPRRAAGLLVPQLLGPSSGGIRVHVATLAAGLDRRGIRAPVYGPAQVMDGLGPQAGVVPVPAGVSPIRLLRARRDLRRRLDGADVVHAHGLKAGWTAVGGRAPVVITVHNVVLAESAGRAAGAQRLLERAVLRRADRVIAPTAAMAEVLARTVEADRVRVVIPASPVPLPHRTRQEIRVNLGASDDTPLVVCVSRLHPQKDLGTLLEAWARVSVEVPHARLAVVGEGPDREKLASIVERLGISGSVVLAGSSPNAVDEMGAADVVVLTSVWEAIPLVLAEAMQLGVPVVTTDVGMASELIGDGDGGVVVPLGDSAAVANEIVRLLGDPERARRVGAAGRDRARDRFDPEALVDQVISVYEELL